MDRERKIWADYGRQALLNELSPGIRFTGIRENLIPAFQYYIGTTLLGEHGDAKMGMEWLHAAALGEEGGLFSATFLLGYLERHPRGLKSPGEPFGDPQYFIHFAGVPAMKTARENFVAIAGHSLPQFDRPFRFIDIGCGDGKLSVEVIRRLQETGKVKEVEEVLLIDPSPAMLEIAEATLVDAYPRTSIHTMPGRLQDCSGDIDRRFDVAMSSLAFHHMPAGEKKTQLERLKPWIDHFLLFELDANHDGPELASPELVLSVYQAYGRIIDFVFAHDAPVDVATGCVDSFLMAELVSLLSEPRGRRRDYHMLRGQWETLFATTLGPDLTPGCIASCYADQYVDLFAMHWGK